MENFENDRYCKNAKYFSCAFISKRKAIKIIWILQKSSNVHSKQTRFSSSECLHIPLFKSVLYGMNSITNACIQSWNKLAKDVVKPCLTTTSIATKNENVTTRKLSSFLGHNDTLIVASPSPSPYLLTSVF